jgi:phytoene synthase
VGEFRIPTEYLHWVLDGIEMDLHVTLYRSFTDLYGYCFRVASVVGLACIRVWGAAGNEAAHFAERAGVAFQLTNVLRDLAEDAARGRCYLPLEDLERFGYTVEDLARGTVNGQFRQLMDFQIERARRFYEEAEPLRGCLPSAGRAVFLIMSRTYQSLLDSVQRFGGNVLRERARVPNLRKARLVLQALPVRWGWL